ncbi:MAG: PIG-L family deacetylase [Planctomycetota bacterium]|nr:PIG-L family deacetylase [Planctomycetota bacterium]MDA1211624.1 PIG-L family deacetylase [Planctomycetota bacterium]
MKTLLAMGAHLDDCIFGVPGIMLHAVRKHYRVVNLAMIGDLTNWPPARGREQEIVDGTKRLCEDRGVEMRVLDFASMRFDVTLEAKQAVAEVVADVKPDIAFILWPHDTHADHEVASQLCKVALRHGGRVLDPGNVTPPRAIYTYDNGPGHTIGFVPNTFVDVSDVWDEAIEWLGRYMALQQNKPYDPAVRDGAQQAKEAIARYRGQSCGVKYAEALWATAARPQEIL